MDEIKCLDKGYVRYIDSMGDDLSIVRAARVSHQGDWKAGRDAGSDERLIEFLWKNSHSTPFEAVTFTFEVKAPIFVFRQWHRHRTQSYNEMSARYSEMVNEFYVPHAEDIGVPHPTNKQQRIMPTPYTDMTQRENETVWYHRTCANAFIQYRILLDAGWPRELARAVLPVATYSRMFCTLNLLNAFRFLTLRDDGHAQSEIRQYAVAMSKLISHTVPVAHKMFSRWKPHMINQDEATTPSVYVP